MVGSWIEGERHDEDNRKNLNMGWPYREPRFVSMLTSLGVTMVLPLYRRRFTILEDTHRNIWIKCQDVYNLFSNISEKNEGKEGREKGGKEILLIFWTNVYISILKKRFF